MAPAVICLLLPIVNKPDSFFLHTDLLPGHKPFPPRNALSLKVLPMCLVYCVTYVPGEYRRLGRQGCLPHEAECRNSRSPLRGEGQAQLRSPYLGFGG